MTLNPRRAKRRQSLRLWSFDQAQAAVPYVSSIVRSLRERAIQMQSLRNAVTQIENKPGRPDRKAIIALDSARKDLSRAELDYGEALDELEALDFQLLDANQGQALVPFAHDDQLAWYIFDLFDNEPIRSWRFQSDPEETRRKLTSAQKR